MRMQTFFLSKDIGTKMLFFLPQLYLPKWNIKCRKLYDWTTYTTYIPIYQNTTKYRSIVVVPSRIADNR